MEQIEEINRKFNNELLQQIEGVLPKEHTYELGMPSEILQSVQIPNLPIELRASRLRDKAMQEMHPFELKEIMDLPKVVQNPLAVFRSATHLKHYVIMTELEHCDKNFILALQINRHKENNAINDISVMLTAIWRSVIARAIARSNPEMFVSWIASPQAARNDD